MLNKKTCVRLFSMILLVAIAISGTAFASKNWSTGVTFSVTKGDDYKIKQTLVDTKLYDNTDFVCKYTEKTMLTRPTFKYFNSNDVSRSAAVTTALLVSVTVTGTGEGVKNYYYYGGVKPSSAQVGTDSIKMAFYIN